MTSTTRPLDRLRRLQVMGVLGWLMLVFNASAATPMSMLGMPHAGAAHAAVAAISAPHCHEQMASAATTPSSSDVAGPCDGAGGPHCTCAAICVAAVAPAPLHDVVTVARNGRYTMPARIDVPSLAIAPLLRPPAV